MFDDDSGSLDEVGVQIMRDFGFEGDGPSPSREFFRLNTEFLSAEVQSSRGDWGERFALGMSHRAIPDRTEREVPRSNLRDPCQLDQVSHFQIFDMRHRHLVIHHQSVLLPNKERHQVMVLLRIQHP